jgi:hypothetical protein
MTAVRVDATKNVPNSFFGRRRINGDRQLVLSKLRALLSGEHLSVFDRNYCAIIGKLFGTSEFVHIEELPVEIEGIFDEREYRVQALHPVDDFKAARLPKSLRKKNQRDRVVFPDALNQRLLLGRGPDELR